MAQSALAAQRNAFYHQIKGSINPATGKKLTPGERGALWQQERIRLGLGAGKRRSAAAAVAVPAGIVEVKYAAKYAPQAAVPAIVLAQSGGAGLTKKGTVDRRRRPNPIAKVRQWFRHQINPTTRAVYTMAEAVAAARAQGADKRAGAITFLQRNGMNVSMYV